ncbi:eukaryotic polypeptide chain release factor 3 [Roridomyces roridus]|uniref:Eukaryotic peptide chain release factor GTP-binding subunit n=1 Tax=Roridomyces roridus TaxID=1738132 RepID=A0AAD7C6E9_9AGAR|nr:eukaryotic polypeptide chain release factor 3 [Roridomyces roridus]
MSKLNAGAFEFVPGRGFPLPQPAAPLPPPVERPEQTEAPRPPPTISLNIGGSKPTPAPAPAAPVAPPPQAAAPRPQPVAQSAPAPSKTFSTEKAKTDTTAIAQEVRTVADAAVLEDLYGDVKEHLNIVFIGHVDAGKSTMGGNLLYLTGMVDKRTMEKYEREAKEAGRESWYLSWALDSTPQERAKGKTVEVGRAYFETDLRRYTILDAPGHKTFVPSMISGAAQADIAILVISARKGEFETGFEKGGQTREHIMLVKTAGVSKVIVVINKMDDPTVNWDKGRYEEIRDKLIPFIRAAGFNPKTDVTFIPVSAFTGANLKERVSKSVAPWYSGVSFLEHVDHMPMVDRKINAPLMMPVAEKYKDMGTIIVGKVESGHMRKGDALILMPNKDSVEVAAIYNEMEEEVNAALCGDNVRIRLRGVDDEDISPGFMLTSPSKPIHAVRQFQAELAILEHKSIICAGYSAVMHIHTLSEEVTLTALLHYFDKATGRKSRKPPQFAKRGQKIVALIETTAPVCVERFSDYPQLGRFTLRDEGRTIAIGKITKLVEGTIEEAAEGVANMSVADA